MLGCGALEGVLAASVGMAGAILILVFGAQFLDWRWLALLAGVTFPVAYFRTTRRIPSPYRVAQIVDDRLIIEPGDSILLKRGRLTPEEMREMRRHAEMGGRILGDTDSSLLRLACEIAETHHEKFDGSGYPRGLKGEEIPLGGRIVAVADVFDALNSTRPYKKAWSVDESRAYIEQHSGQHFDPRCVQAFVDGWNDVLAIRSQFPD